MCGASAWYVAPNGSGAAAVCCGVFTKCDSSTTVPAIIAITTSPATNAAGNRLRSSSWIRSPGSTVSSAAARWRHRHDRNSAAKREAQNQRLGQSELHHALLHVLNIIRNAPELDGMIVEVRDGERRAGVSIARLADRPGIQQIRCAGNELDTQRFIRQRGLGVQRGHVMPAQRESALNVRVAEEYNRRRRIDQAVGRLLRTKHVFVFVIHRAVHHRKSAGRLRTLRKLFEIFQISGRDALARPQHSRVRHGIEFFRVGQSGHGFVVIAADGRGAKLAHQFDGLVGIGTVAHQVAQADSLVPFALRRLKHRPKRRNVRVNVAKNQILQTQTPLGKANMIDEYASQCTSRRYPHAFSCAFTESTSRRRNCKNGIRSRPHADTLAAPVRAPRTPPPAPANSTAANENSSAADSRRGKSCPGKEKSPPQLCPPPRAPRAARSSPQRLPRPARRSYPRQESRDCRAALARSRPP